MKFVLLINLRLLTTANSFLLNIAEHENFSANKYENANYSAEHEKSLITSGLDQTKHLSLHCLLKPVVMSKFLRFIH